MNLQDRTFPAMVTSAFVALAGLAVTTGANAQLIHHYTFDSGSVAIDSIGGANGTLFGGASIIGGALLLDGSSGYVETLGNHIVPTSGNFTISMFARQTVSSNGFVELISQGDLGSRFFFGHDPAGNFRVAPNNSSSSLFPTDGGYHNYALTYQGSTANLYVDGALVETFSGISYGAGGTNTRFGRQFDPFGEYFNGLIDDVRIYNSALSSAEIHAIANPVAAIPEPETYAMLLAGLGVLGFAAHRRKRMAGFA